MIAAIYPQIETLRVVVEEYHSGAASAKRDRYFYSEADSDFRHTCHSPRCTGDIMLLSAIVHGAVADRQTHAEVSRPCRGGDRQGRCLHRFDITASITYRQEGAR